MTDVIQRFDSLAEMFAFIRANPRAHIAPRTQAEFFGRGTEAAMRYVEQGASELEQRQTKALLEKIDAGIERTRREFTPGPAGAYVNVPEYLMGQPMHMRRRIETEAQAAPVRIVIETLVSSGVNAATMARRGAAVSALAMRLSEVRPVELWAAWSMWHKTPNAPTVVGRVKLDTLPLDLSQCVAVMNTREFMRAITFANMHAAGHTTQNNKATLWGWRMDPTESGRTARMREALSLDEADIFIPGGYLSEADQMMHDPVAWVNKYLDSQREIA